MKVHFFESAIDSEKKLALGFWKNSLGAKNPPKGLIWLIHGVGEHIGRYGKMAQFFANAGYDVAGLDHMGHGLSAKEGGWKRLGSFPEMLHEQETQIHKVLTQGLPGQDPYRHSPWYIVAHSMGALVALYWMVRGKSPAFQADFARKAFLSAPPLKLQMQVPAWKELASTFLSSALPDVQIPNGIEVTDLSHDLQNQKDYLADPLVHRSSSPRNYESLKRVADEVNAGAQNIEIPVCLAVGMDDPIIDVAEVGKFYERMATHKKLLKFEKRRHEIFNDTGREEVWGEVLKWLQL